MTECQSLVCFRVSLADLTEMRSNVLMEAGYMFGCGHYEADLLIDASIEKSLYPFGGTSDVSNFQPFHRSGLRFTGNLRHESLLHLIST